MTRMMARLRNQGWRARAALAAGLALLGGLVAWSRRADDPPRAVFRATEKSWPQGFTPDGRVFVTAGPEAVVSWGTATWRAGPAWPLRAFTVHAFSRDGRSCVGEHGYDVESARIVRADVATGTALETFAAGLPRVITVTYLDGDRAIRALLGDRTGTVLEVVTWDLATGAETRRPIRGPVGKGFLPDAALGRASGGRIVGFRDPARDAVQPWDVETDRPIGAPLVNPSGPPAWLWWTATFTQDGRQLVIGRADGAVDVWDLAGGRLVRTIPVHPAGYAARDMQVSPDGRTLASTGSFHHAINWAGRAALAVKGFVDRGNPSLADDGVVVVDLATGRRLARWPGAFHPRFSPDGRTVVTHQSWSGTFAVRDAPQPPGR